MYFDDVAPGAVLEPQIRQPSSRDLVLFAAGSGDFYEIHYDDAVARASGLPAVIVHGRLKAIYLTQLVTSWMGEAGKLRSFTVRFSSVDLVAQPMTLGGRVSRCAPDLESGFGDVTVELWIDGAEGARSTQASAVVQLPSRAAAEQA